MEVVRRYLYEDRTNLFEELESSSTVDLIELAIGLKLSVLERDYDDTGDHLAETVADTLSEFCPRLASSKSTQ